MMDLTAASSVVIMALTIWREARGEPYAAKCGVAGAIMNRVARPKWWGSDPWSVCTKRLQFSSLTDPKDRQLTTWPTASDPSWRECLRVAAGALDGTIPHPLPGADTYHDISIEMPASWGKPRFCGQLGRLRFYDVDNDVEVVQPAAAAA